jgi:aldose 1-epimerase
MSTGTDRPRPPSGEQIEIALGDQRVVVVGAGGGLRSYTAAGENVINPYGASEMSSSGRGQLLIPWPNRIEDGSYDFDGRTHQLPIDRVQERNAIHGLVRWSSWTVGQREPHRVVMEHEIAPRPGYPFSLALAVEYMLSSEGLRVATTATNVGRDVCPYGCGAHPFLTLGRPIDSLVLDVPARTALLSDERGLPMRSAPVEECGWDFRRPRAIGSTSLDNAFTDLDRGGDGLAHVTLADPAGKPSVTLWVDEAYGYLMLFTGDPPSDVARGAIAVEPMTCPPNAFRTGEALIRLEPGESFTGTWGIGPSHPTATLGRAGG